MCNLWFVFKLSRKRSIKSIMKFLFYQSDWELWIKNIYSDNFCLNFRGSKFFGVTSWYRNVLGAFNFIGSGPFWRAPCFRVRIVCNRLRLITSLIGSNSPELCLMCLDNAFHLKDDHIDILLHRKLINDQKFILTHFYFNIFWKTYVIYTIFKREAMC